MKHTPLLSIVVPTKDRYCYLKHLISLIKSFESDEIELIIQDNTSDNSDILDFIESLHYDHLKYFHDKESLPISLNADKAILNSIGKYVCFIGDDDGVTKEILDLPYLMEEKNYEAVIVSNASYRWPDAYGTEKKGILKYKTFNGNIHSLSSKKILEECMKYGFTYRDGLPCVYHGVVKRTVLDKIYSVCQSYFPGPSPDIANGVAVSLVIDKVILINKPIIIPGAGKVHGGGKERENIELRKLPFLPDNIIEKWEPRIPRAWTATTIWCESSIKALRAMHREDLINDVDFDYMYAVFITLYPKHWRKAVKLSRNKIFLLFALLLRVFRIIKTHFVYRVDNDYIVVDGISNIKEAASLLSSRF